MKSLCLHQQPAIACKRALRNSVLLPLRCGRGKERAAVAVAAAAVRHQPQQPQQHHEQQSKQHPQQQQQQPTDTWQQRTAVAVATALVLASSCGGSAAIAATAEANFANKCAGCHLNGGNVLAAGATLFSEDLVRNSLADSEPMYSLLYSGKGRMPGFGADCAPKGACTFGPRLTDDELRDLVQYVQEAHGGGLEGG